MCYFKDVLLAAMMNSAVAIVKVISQGVTVVIAYSHVQYLYGYMHNDLS